jgi:hypothetical protein
LNGPEPAAEPSANESPDVDESIDVESERDQRLAIILSDVTDAICRGEVIDIESVCRSNPELSDELKRLLGAVLVTDTAGASRDEGLADTTGVTSRWRKFTFADHGGRLRIDRRTRSRRHGRRLSRSPNQPGP